MLATCVICGADFDARGKAITCSPVCSKARRVAREATPEYKARKAAYHADKWANDPEYRARKAAREATPEHKAWQADWYLNKKHQVDLAPFLPELLAKGIENVKNKK